MQRIKAPDAGVAPLAIGNENNFGIIHNVAPFIWTAGGDLIKDDGTTSTARRAGRRSTGSAITSG